MLKQLISQTGTNAEGGIFKLRCTPLACWQTTLEAWHGWDRAAGDLPRHAQRSSLLSLEYFLNSDSETAVSNFFVYGRHGVACFEC
jgi:hypothetical protein